MQALIDELADRVMNQLIARNAMSSSQVNDANKVPTSSLVYSMNQQIEELNSDLRYFAVITVNISTESGYDEFNSQIASLPANTKFIGNLRIFSGRKRRSIWLESV